jgi:nitronate monooxygenase
MAKVAMPKDLLEEAEDHFQEGLLGPPVESEKGVPKHIGVGFITWSASLEEARLSNYCPAAVWLFALPKGSQDLIPWDTKIREASASRTKI